ncbi:hypothetical protein NDU88_010186 [Pleurodeles waltl]|uniref:Uncharacterized protein n=1 Tax=Pleurodeles waltl TaxID=8319 RepID=A0AAV7PY28_PLEWA|nr:hypothetical protein NDU88_010186 [Pleurodeles waltl]
MHAPCSLCPNAGTQRLSPALLLFRLCRSTRCPCHRLHCRSRLKEALKGPTAVSHLRSGPRSVPPRYLRHPIQSFMRLRPGELTVPALNWPPCSPDFEMRADWKQLFYIV